MTTTRPRKTITIRPPETSPSQTSEDENPQYGFEDIKGAILKLCHAELVDEVSYNDFVQAIWYMLVRNAPGGIIIADTLFMFSLDVIGIINDYLTFKIYEPNEIMGGIQIISGSISQNIENPLNTDLNISFIGSSSAKPHQGFKKYLGMFASQPIHKIELGEDEKKTTVHTRVITMPNTAWMNPGLHFAAQEAFIDYSKEQKKSSKPKPDQEDEEHNMNLHLQYAKVTTLKKIKKLMSEREEYKIVAKELITLLKEYIDCTESTPDTDEKLKKLRVTQEKIGQAIKDIYPNFIKTLDKPSQSKLFCCPTFYNLFTSIQAATMEICNLFTFKTQKLSDLVEFSSAIVEFG